MQGFVEKTKYLIVALICVALAITAFNLLIVQQEEILRKYFIITPQEKLKEFRTSLSSSVSKYFTRENRTATLEQVAEYIKKFGTTSLFDTLFVFQDKFGSLKQVSNFGVTTAASALLSGENVYPVSVDSGNIEGYLMVMMKDVDDTETREGLMKYRLITYTLRLIFLLLVAALLIILFYHDYSARMKHARDMAVIKASHDGLTGLHTHEYFMKALAIETERARIYRMPLAVLMLDIDHFKTFNDRYGHQAGDKVLEEVSRIVTVSTRATDVLGRYGGEEFAVLVPYVEKRAEITDLEKANNFFQEVGLIAERIRKNVEDNSVEFSAQALKVTVSVGLAFYHEGTYDSTYTALLQRADKALYKAKGLGRNRVCIAEGPAGQAGKAA